MSQHQQTEVVQHVHSAYLPIWVRLWAVLRTDARSMFLISGVYECC